MLEMSVMMTVEDCRCTPTLKVLFLRASTKPPVFGPGFVYTGCYLGAWFGVFCTPQITTCHQHPVVTILYLNAYLLGDMCTYEPFAPKS